MEQGNEGVHPRYRRLDLFGVPRGALIRPWPPNLALITGPRKSGLSLSLSTSPGNEITSCALSMPEPNVKPIEPGLLAAAVSGIIDRWWSPLINTMVYRTVTTRFFMPKYLQFKGDSRREEVWEKIFGSFERNFRLILKSTWSFIVKNIFPSFEYSNHNLERN